MVENDSELDVARTLAYKCCDIALYREYEPASLQKTYRPDGGETICAALFGHADQRVRLSAWGFLLVFYSKMQCFSAGTWDRLTDGS